MKNFLLFILAMPLAFNAQVLFSENFDSYALGPVSTDLTGATAGASGYWVYADSGTSTNVDQNSIQFVTEGGTNGLQLIGPNGGTGIAYTSNDEPVNVWAGRTAGYDVIRISGEFTITSTTTSENIFNISLYDSSYQKVLVGARISISDMEVFPLGNYDNSGTIDNYYFTPTTPNPINTGVNTFMMSYNKTDGVFKLQVNGGDIYAVPGAAAGTDPQTLIYMAARLSTNTSSSTVVLDNIEISATESPLGVEDINANASISVLYPNPAKDFVNVRLSESFDSAKTQITVTDLSGKQVMSVQYAEEINVSTLEKGVYMMTITDGNQIENQKLIKQ